MTGPSRPPNRRPCLAVSVGEPGGIGAELLLQLYRERTVRDVPPFFIVGDPDFVAARARDLGWNVPVRAVSVQEGASYFRESLPVVPTKARMGNHPGTLDPADGAAVVEAIETAVLAVAGGHAAAVVTAPIHKANLYATGFSFPGHTEFLGALGARLWPRTPVTEPVMMLAGPELRTVPVTVHIALAEVPRRLTLERIVTVGDITARDLRHRFGIAFPRLALAGLNPHAGENGAMGTEDDAIIAPAVAALRARGIDATGPHPADTLFHAAARQTYDAVLAMYHDQALIPVKTIAFDETVNVTLGLPFIRTSPDHGTALDIAAKGIARPQSLLSAMKLAAEMANRHD